MNDFCYDFLVFCLLINSYQNNHYLPFALSRIAPHLLSFFALYVNF